MLETQGPAWRISLRDRKEQKHVCFARQEDKPKLEARGVLEVILGVEGR